MDYKNLKHQILRTMIILCGASVTLYPWISNYSYEKSAGSEIMTYEQDVADTNETEIAQALKDAHSYNSALAESHIRLTDPFAEKTRSTTLSRYEILLDLSKTGVMASVEIPCIGVRLPIYHGTSSEALEKGVGHLEGSSLPIGGEGTHAVLTGHTGLSAAKLFTDLTEMEKGDLFYIHILGKVLAYQVDEINIVYPQETDRLTVLQGEDHVTLITCTPYGVNSHRLLVRGTRTEYVEEERQERRTDMESQWLKEYREALLIGLVTTAILCAVGKAAGKIAEHSKEV